MTQTIRPERTSAGFSGGPPAAEPPPPQRLPWAKWWPAAAASCRGPGRRGSAPAAAAPRGSSSAPIAASRVRSRGDQLRCRLRAATSSVFSGAAGARLQDRFLPVSAAASCRRVSVHRPLPGPVLRYGASAASPSSLRPWQPLSWSPESLRLSSRTEPAFPAARLDRSDLPLKARPVKDFPYCGIKGRRYSYIYSEKELRGDSY